jgi:hypothetical protein
MMVPCPDKMVPSYNDIPAGGVVARIGVNYAHVVTAEDYFVSTLLTGGTPLRLRMTSSMSELPPPGTWTE